MRAGQSRYGHGSESGRVTDVTLEVGLVASLRASSADFALFFLCRPMCVGYAHVKRPPSSRNSGAIGQTSFDRRAARARPIVVNTLGGVALGVSPVVCSPTASSPLASWKDVGPQAQDRPRMGDIEHHHPGKHSHIYIQVLWASLRLRVLVPIFCLRGSSRHTLSTRGRVINAQLQSRLSTYDLSSTTSTLPCQLSPLVHSSPALRTRLYYSPRPTTSISITWKTLDNKGVMLDCVHLPNFSHVCDAGGKCTKPLVE